MPHTLPVPSTSLATVKLQFKIRRETRKQKSRTPDELWAAAVSLSNRYSIHYISKAQHVNHTALRDRVSANKKIGNQQTHSCFIELSLHQALLSKGYPPSSADRLKRRSIS